MDKISRVQTIKDLLLKRGQLDIQEIMQILAISEPTARRDVLHLIQTEELYCKIRNGVSLISQGHEAELLFEEKLNVQSHYKKVIAKKAAQMILPNQTLLIDSGTTCFFLAKEILGRKLQVVTSDLRIAYELSKDKDIRLHVIGGEIRSGYYSIGGILACQNIGSFFVDTLVMSADAFNCEDGITNVETFEVPVKQSLRRAAKNLMLLIDSSKIGPRSFYKIMDTGEVDILVTDDRIEPAQAAAIRKLGIKLIVAPS